MVLKIERELLSQARALGLKKAQVVHGGKHPKLRGWCGDKHISYVIPKTPSDYRSLKNWISGLKRKMRTV